MPELLENNDSGNTGDSLPQMSLSFVDSMDGHAFEYWCAELLRKNGFSSIEVTQGSGDQGVDVIATKDDIRYAIQCKCYSSDLGNKPIQEVNTGKALYKCHVGVVMTNRYFTQGGKEAADATGVLLWDRDKLQEMINKTDMGDTEIQVDKAAPVSDDENNSIVIYDELFFSAGDLVIERKEVNVSMLQQELLITYDVAAAIVHQMEKINMITLCDGEYILLIGKQQWEEWKTWKRQNS